jgi:endonuclease/exonuclease/phosphatase (EEP) superfamily protein YafD
MVRSLSQLREPAKRIVVGTCTALSVLYACLIALWFVLHAWLGDTAWWLALLNVFAPHLFLPLALLVPACLFCRRRSVWISTAVPCLVWAALYGHLFLPAPPTAHAAEKAPLTVMSFNVWGGSGAPETARVLLDHGAPDVVALQELSPQMAQVLLAELGDVYPYQIFEPGRGYGYHGMGVLSRYPLTALDTSGLRDRYWRIQVVRVETGNGPITLYNAHPSSTNVVRYLREGIPIDEGVRTSFAARRALARRLVDDIARRPGPKIVAGDWNSTDQSDAYAILSEHLTDAHRAVGWGLGHTFPAYARRYRGFPILPRQIRIDMIFCSQAFVPLRSSVGAAYGESDHLPVVAAFGWRQ